MTITSLTDVLRSQYGGAMLLELEWRREGETRRLYVTRQVRPDDVGRGIALPASMLVMPFRPGETEKAERRIETVAAGRTRITVQLLPTKPKTCLN